MAMGSDFATIHHLFGHAFGDAVICWSPAGKVAVIGKLYAPRCPRGMQSSHRDSKNQVSTHKWQLDWHHLANGHYARDLGEP